MRNLFYLAFLLSGICSGWSQDYRPLLASNLEWHLTSCYYGCVSDKYFAQTDTIVGGLTYKILDGYHYISRTFLLREDIIQRKVYLCKVDPNRIDEYLLYDFSMQVGDSISVKNPISPFPTHGGYYKLDSITLAPLADNHTYRHFHLSPSSSNFTSQYPITWIEGIGGLSMINAAGGLADINGAGKLSCFFKNGEKVYENLDSISSCIATLSQESIKEKIAPKIWFDKTTNRYTLQSNKSISSIKVFDLNAREIPLSELTQPEDNTLHFVLNYLRGQVLLVQIQHNNEERYYQKIITQ